MILLCGIPSEAPLAKVRDALVELGAPLIVFNQREFADTRFGFELLQDRIEGKLHLRSQQYRLEDITGVYMRLMEDEALPEVRGLPPQAPARQHCRNLHDALIQWLEITPARVVNRCRPMCSNSSKPYQAQLIARHGFSIPETLITNDPALVHDFYARHGQVIYKSISGVRSIVQDLTANDLTRLDDIRWCPTQFQAFVEGTNVRVHVVGGEVFATRITSEVTDYRYASRQGGETELNAVELSDDLAQRCIDLAAGLELPFAGIDLKVTPTEEVFCFEVNPSPGYSYFESSTGQPIAMAVARYLCGNGQPHV